MEPGLPFCPDPGDSSLLLDTLGRSGVGCRLAPDGESAGAGVAGLSGTCSGRGEGRGAASSEGGAGGCMEGGAQAAFRPAEEPLRATQDVSMTLTPMPSFL